MIFKKSKYNIICMLTVMIIVGVFIFQFFITDSVGNGLTEGDLPGQDQEQFDDTVPYQPWYNEGGDETGVEVDPNMPNATKQTLKFLNYALNKLYTSQGYKSEVERTMTNVAVGVEVKQFMKGCINMSGNKAIEDIKFWATGSMADSAANYLRCFYYEGDNVTYYQTPKGNYDTANYQVVNMSRSDYNSKYAIALFERSVIDFSKGTGTIIDRGKDKNGEYYIIKTKIGASDFPRSYIDYYESTGDLKNVAITGGTFTFYIYKNNAQIFKINSLETLSASHPATGFNVTSTVDSKQTFTAYNEAFDIEKP